MRFCNTDDIAGLTAVLDAKAPPYSSVSLDFNSTPKVGEVVFAVGYPELDFQPLHGREIDRYLSEGMFGVYGRVSSLLDDGRGRSRPSPGFEVQADWPAGMSGGPVFNEQGNVIGIVSSSVQPQDGEPGVGFATCLAMVRDAAVLAPTLDVGNPGHRLGFGVYRENPWHLAAVVASRIEAERLRALLPPGYVVGRGSHRMGTDEFLC